MKSPPQAPGPRRPGRQIVGEVGFDLALYKDIAQKTASAAIERIGDWSTDLGHYLDNLRYQVPRLTRLRRLTDDTLISIGRSLAEQAATIGDRTFFLWRGRAFTYSEANRRVEAVVRGLIATGAKPGQRIGVMMRSRPRFAAYDIGGPQLQPWRMRASSWISFGLRVTSSRTTATSSR